MHGSLLPKYRGRVPVNWAMLHGERETGATLHYMTEKPDAGDIVAQQAVPILPDDTAREVFDKVTVAAEIALDRRAARAPRRHRAAHGRRTWPRGSYFGGRKPEDGRIDWSRGAARDPQPGARRRAALSRRVHHGRRRAARLLRTRVLDAARRRTPTWACAPALSRMRRRRSLTSCARLTAGGGDACACFAARAPGIAGVNAARLRSRARRRCAGRRRSAALVATAGWPCSWNSRPQVAPRPAHASHARAARPRPRNATLTTSHPP